ncbi:hypothetical protein BJX68DRAFT_263845 [Aspergillus pseudodeflectus]|uniref:Tubby C-terminal-like domain-containing protein n=1 Tax=Aspergillus pseudodeflectus TaxID=176178 RepID=A0ABR4KVR5_9EURO
MAFLRQPSPIQPRWPLAIRPETVATAEPETVITVRNSPEPWHPLDYTITNQSGATLFTVHGHPWGLAQRRVFRDASGFPLFELRSRWYDSSVLELKPPGALTTSEVILSAKCRVAVQSPRVVMRFRNVCSTVESRPAQKYTHQKSLSRSSTGASLHPEETVMEILALDVDNLVQVAMVDNQTVAVFNRVTDPGVLAQGQKPPFRFRPMWTVRVARGVDLSLIAVAVVIIGQQVAGEGLADQ